MHSICRIAALLAAVTLLPVAHAGQSVYKWVDDEGVTHYTQQPPSNRDAQLVTPNTAIGPKQDSGQSSPGAQQSDASNGDSDAGDAPQNMTEFCNQVRERISMLEAEGPVSVRQSDDSLERLSDEERARQLEQGRRQLQEHCSDDGG